jgi:hypothetical protein
VQFYKALPTTDEVDDVRLQIDEKVAIITHDDTIDFRMIRFERSLGLSSTHFVLSRELAETPIEAKFLSEDVQLHFDKEAGTLRKQISSLERVLGRRPLMNRTHRVLWRSDHIDLAHLAINGIRVDSSKMGVAPYRLCVEGKVLPIWEVPFSVCDGRVTNRLSPIHMKPRDPALLFVQGVTPIVALYHPFTIVKQQGLRKDYEQFCSLILKHGYRCMTMKSFYDAYLALPEEAYS